MLLIISGPQDNLAILWIGWEPLVGIEAPWLNYIQYVPCMISLPFM